MNSDAREYRLVRRWFKRSPGLAANPVPQAAPAPKTPARAAGHRERSRPAQGRDPLTKRAILVALLLALIGVPLWAHWPRPSLPDGTRADRVVVHKGNRTLELYRGTELLRSYRVALGPHPVGRKEREGDGRTPEGRYIIDYRNPHSSFHKSLHISYPSTRDAAAAYRHGASPGGLIMVHGLRNGWGALGRFGVARDWTAGCIAVTDRDIDEIWRTVADGTPILIEP